MANYLNSEGSEGPVITNYIATVCLSINTILKNEETCLCHMRITKVQISLRIRAV